MATIRECVSRIRNLFKASTEDAFITDRLIYSLIKSAAKAYMFRETQRISLFYNTSLFKEIPCLELIDVSVVDECCSGLRTNCTIKRSKEKLPTITSLASGPIVASVSSMDYSIKLTKTTPANYNNIKRSSAFKFNKNKYYWIINNYLYVPDVEWDAVRVLAMFEDDISPLYCNEGNDKECVLMQETETGIPDYLFHEIDTAVLNEMAVIAKIPADNNNDSTNIMR